MADEEVKIKIRTEADVKGIKDLSRELQAQVAASKVTTAAEKEMAKSSLEAATAKRGLGAAAKGLAGQFPILAQSLRMLMNPITAVFGAATAIIGVFKKWSASIDEASEKSQQLARFKEHLDGAKTSAIKLREELEQYDLALKKAAQSQDAIADRMQNEIALSKELLQLRTELAGLTGGGTEKEKVALGREQWNVEYTALLQARNAYQAQAAGAKAGLPSALISESVAADNLKTAREAKAIADAELTRARGEMTTAEATGLGPSGLTGTGRARNLEAKRAAVAEAKRRLDEAGATLAQREAEFTGAETRRKDLQALGVRAAGGLGETTRRLEGMAGTIGATQPLQEEISRLRIAGEGPAYHTQAYYERMMGEDRLGAVRDRAQAQGVAYANAVNDAWINLMDDLLEAVTLLDDKVRAVKSRVESGRTD